MENTRLVMYEMSEIWSPGITLARGHLIDWRGDWDVIGAYSGRALGLARLL